MPALIKKIWQDAKLDSSLHLQMKVDQLTKKVLDLENTIRENRKAFVLSIPEGNGHRFIDSDDILYVQAQGNYSTIFVNNGSQYLISKTLKAISEGLPDASFVRCHAAYLVNTKYIIKTGDSSSLELISGDVLPISRRKYQSLIEQLSNRS